MTETKKAEVELLEIEEWIRNISALLRLIEKRNKELLEKLTKIKNNELRNL